MISTVHLFKVSKENHNDFKNNLTKLNEAAFKEADETGCNRIILVAECKDFWYYRAWYQTQEENLKII